MVVVGTSQLVITTNKLASLGGPPGAGGASHQKTGLGFSYYLWVCFSSWCEMYSTYSQPGRNLPVPQVSVYKAGFIFVHVVLFVSAHQIPSAP